MGMSHTVGAVRVAAASIVAAAGTASAAGPDPVELSIDINKAEVFGVTSLGVVTDTIKGRAHGEKSNLSYERVYKKYENVAEEATQREEIPLTRRSYIKRYFESIRPKSRKK